MLHALWPGEITIRQPQDSRQCTFAVSANYANPLVHEAHHRVPPAGFKYLVTEMVCWATGGAQKYTGKSMAESHRDLKIASEEWEAFLDDFQQTLDKFKVPDEEQAELKAIVNSTRSDIVANPSLAVGTNA
jgi:hemoglobin